MPTKAELEAKVRQLTADVCEKADELDELDAKLEHLDETIKKQHEDLRHERQEWDKLFKEKSELAQRLVRSDAIIKSANKKIERLTVECAIARTREKALLHYIISSENLKEGE